MPDIDEGLILDGLDLNNTGGPYITEALTFKPAEKKLQWAENAAADGDALVDEAHYTNAFFEAWRIRIEPQKSMDEALTLLGKLTDKLQKAERTQGGIPLPWTPASSTKTWAWYALACEYEELPITPEGDLAGWFLASPVVTIKVTCRPFGHGAEKRVLAPVSSSLPLHEAILEDPGGDVPAEARIIVVDKAGQDRRHGEIGLEQLAEKAAAPPLTIDSDSMTVTGFAGVLAERTGAYDPNAAGSNVVRCPAISSPVVACSTGPIANVGSFRLKPRIYAISEDLRVRASYKVGDGPYRALEWKRPIVINGFCEIDLLEATLDRLVKGEQKSEIRIEVKSVGAKTEADIDYLNLIPTMRGRGKARGIASDSPTALLAYDEADQAAGNLTGGSPASGISAITAASPGVITCNSHGLANGERIWIEGIVGTMGEVLTGFFTVAGVTTNTFNVGVNTTGKTYTSGGKISKGGKTLPYPTASTSWWFGTGDPDDAAVNATAHTFERTAVSDSSVNAGRFFLPFLSAVAAVKVQAGFKATSSIPLNIIANVNESDLTFRLGVVARYRDASNWLLACLTNALSQNFFEGILWTNHTLQLVKCVAGVVSRIDIADSQVKLTSGGDIALSVDSAGVFQVWSGPSETALTTPRITGQDSALATGGALATGRVGWYDAWKESAKCTRTVDRFSVLTPEEAGRVCYANRSAEARPDEDWIREDADGGDWGPPSIYRGANFWLPPAGDTTAVNRLAVKLRRGDVDVEADPFIADKHQLEVWATPRVLVPR